MERNWVSQRALTHIIPNNGGSSGGTKIFIEGTGFLQGVKVAVGGNAGIAQWQDENTIQVVTPSNPPGIWDVRMLNPDTQEVTAEMAFISVGETVYNFPNPFRTSQGTTFRYMTRHRGRNMKIKIFNLITEPVKDYMRYDRKAVERILRLTAGHPFFTQAICLQLIEDMNDKQQNRVSVEYVDEACRELVENPPFHLAYLWGELSPEEKIMIALLAEVLPDGLAYASVGDIVSKQSEYELVYERATISKTLTKLIGDHLVSTKPGTDSYRFRMDFIRAWLQSEHPIWGVLREVQNHE